MAARQKKRSLLVLLAALLVLVGAYVAVTQLSAEEDAATDGTIALAACQEADIASLEWEYNNQTMQLEHQDADWVFMDDPEFPLKSEYVQAMLSAVDDASATRQLEELADLAEYGLDAPAVRVRVNMRDGSQTSFAVGAQNQLNDSYYLTLNNDQSTVYLTDRRIPEAFSRDVLGMVELEALPSMGSNVTIFTMAGTAVQPLMMVKSELTDATGQTTSAWFKANDQGELEDFDLSTAQTLLYTVSGLVWAGCADYQLEADELPAYGLDEPLIRVQIDYQAADESAQVFLLNIGAPDGDCYYAQISDSARVYLIDQAVVEILTADDPAATAQRIDDEKLAAMQ